MRRDLSRVLSAKCNRFAYTYNKQGFLCKFSLLTLLMIATEPIPVPEELRQVQAHPGGLDEVVSGEIRCGHRPPPAGADAHPAPGQGSGVVRDFPFPAASGKMKSALRATPPLGQSVPKPGARPPRPTSGHFVQPAGGGRRRSIEQERNIPKDKRLFHLRSSKCQNIFRRRDFDGCRPWSEKSSTYIGQ